MYRRILSILIVSALTHLAVADERMYPFEQIELDNGLKVISLEDFSCPIVAVQVWYHVGSKDEDPERQGFAHMFEHMMFRGTDRVGPEEHFDFIRRVGGGCNAYTSFDQTVYQDQLPSNQLELALWLEAERMAFLKIDRDGFFTERNVVKEERRMGLNQPYGTVMEKLLAEMFHKHPYRWATIGCIPHLEAATIDELQVFWDTYYVPNNAVLVVVGAVKHADVQKLAKKHFGWIPRCPEPPRVTIKEPQQAEPRMVTLKEEKGPLPIVGALYRTVPTSHPDQLPLEILMNVLGGGESSRLYVDAVKEQGIAQVALAGAFGLEQDGIMGAGGVLLPVVGDKKQMMKTIGRHLKRVMRAPITQAELDKIKNQLRRQEIDGTVSVDGKAARLGEFAVLYGDAERINRRIAEIEAVTVEDVQRVARKYLKKEHRIGVIIEPSVGGMFKSLFGSGYEEGTAEGSPAKMEGVNRVAKRTGAKSKAVRPESLPAQAPFSPMLDALPEIPTVSKVLPNGLKVVVVSNREVPMVWTTLGFRSGSWTEAKPGVASAAMEMLTKGTKTRDAKTIAETLESAAIRLNSAAEMDTAIVDVSAMLPQLDLAVELAADVVRNPVFPENEFKILLQQTRMGLMVSSNTPEYIAEREFRQRLFGDHPYARKATGELEDLNDITTADAKAWWAANVRPDNAVMYVAGDISPDDAYEMIERHFGDWKAEGTLTLPTLAEIPAQQPTRIYIVDRPGSVQSEIRVGHLGITRRNSQYYTSRVLNDIFGGTFNSRLNKAVRVEKGLTYGARGGFSARRFGGTFYAATFTKTASTGEALRTILEEIDKLRAEPPTQEEVADTKTHMAGSFAGDREVPTVTVNDLWMIETQGLPQDYLQRFLAGVKATTPNDVMKAAKTLMDPRHLVIVIVGEAAKIKDELATIAPVTIVGSEAVPGEEGTQEEIAPAK